jgi:arylsulfatase
VRVPEHAAPSTLNRSWAADAHIEVPKDGATGPIPVMGGDGNGWSLYLDESKPTFCYNLAAIQYTYIRGGQPLAPGPHVVRYEFEKRGKEPFGAGGVGRILVDGQKVAEHEIPRTAAFGYSLDETFDVGCDKGAPVTSEYAPLAAFTGKIIKVDIDLKPDLAVDVARHDSEKMRAALLRQ